MSRRKSVLKNYTKLRDCVRERIALGRTRMEEERVQTYHEVGKMIAQHCDQFPEKAGYGKKVVVDLSDDLGISDSLLFEIVRFAKTYPKLHARGLSGRSLNWTDYRKLISIEDPSQRKALEAKILKEDLSTREIQDKVRKTATKNQKEADLLKPLIGKLDTYRVVDGSEAGILDSKELFFDHGFRMYRRLTKEECENVKAGDLVEFISSVIPDKLASPLAGRSAIRDPGLDSGSEPGMTNGRIIKSNRSDKDRFFYQATVEKVVDGDTLWAAIDIGFSEITRQKLRLRDVDAPELLEKGGAESFRFLKSILPPGTSILLHTSASPNHDRFVADVYVRESLENKKTITKIQGTNKFKISNPNVQSLGSCILFLGDLEYIFLNNLILVLQFASRFEE